MNRIYSVFAVFRDVVEKSSQLKDVKWVLAGSLAGYINGLDVVPMDVDILTDKKGVLGFYDVLRDDFEIVAAPKYSETELYASFYSRYKRNGVYVEIMGDFVVKTELGKINISFYDIWNLSEYFRSALGRFKVVPLELQLLYNIFIPGKERRVEMILERLKERLPSFRVIREIKKVVNPFIWERYVNYLAKIIDVSEL